ncbi:MAG: glycosyltransferase family 2 protein [Bacteroidetes bacterium]|nr:glycosyltransferase family 2 protein [Bacteroidota bacterium]
MHLLIQIVNYNTREYLLKCLESLQIDLENYNEEYRIFILDNASNDNLDDVEQKFRNTKVFYSPKNLGFGGGHNYLFKMTESKYLLILNPDLLFFEPDTIKRLFNSMAENKADVIGPKLIGFDKKPQIGDHGESIGFIAAIKNNLGASHWINRENPDFVAWISGGFMLLDSKYFKKINGFDEKFFLFKEEEDLCLRMRNEGAKIFYDSSVKCLHHSSVVAKKSDHIYKSLDYYIQKHYADKILYKILNPLRIFYNKIMRVFKIDRELI